MQINKKKEKELNAFLDERKNRREMKGAMDKMKPDKELKKIQDDLNKGLDEQSAKNKKKNAMNELKKLVQDKRLERTPRQAQSQQQAAEILSAFLEDRYPHMDASSMRNNTDLVPPSIYKLAKKEFAIGYHQDKFTWKKLLQEINLHSRPPLNPSPIKQKLNLNQIVVLGDKKQNNKTPNRRPRIVPDVSPESPEDWWSFKSPPLTRRLGRRTPPEVLPEGTLVPFVPKKKPIAKADDGGGKMGLSTSKTRKTTDDEPTTLKKRKISILNINYTH